MTNKTTTNKTVSRFIIGASAAALAVLILPSVTFADTLYRQLETGMSGSDVSSLQTFLATDATLYPQGLVTGYFGFLTKSAVSNFQTRNGIPAVGRVGPQTIPVINQQMNSTVYGMTSGAEAPIISPVSISVNRNSATVNWSTNELAKGVVYYSTSPLTTYERENSVDISGSSIMTDANLRNTQSVGIPNLQPNTVYYYMVYTTDQTGNVSVTWPAAFQTSN